MVGWVTLWHVFLTMTLKITKWNLFQKINSLLIKPALINEINSLIGIKDRFVCVTVPRRFRKTLNGHDVGFTLF